MIESTRLAQAIGAELHGVELQQPLDEAAFREIHAALLAHHVLFFRGQYLEDEQHAALARRFGRPTVYPVLQILGGTEPLETIEDDERSGPKADYWHTDITWLAVPPKIGILRAEVIPEVGGDTMWASLHAAWDGLSEAMQGLLEGLTAQHSTGPDFFDRVESALGPEKGALIRSKLRGEARHPLVPRHPETGRRLLYFSGSFFDHIVELSRAESDVLRAFLSQHIDQPEFSVRWKWREGDVAIWDERCTVHRALGDHFPRRRVVRRCTVEAEERPSARKTPRPASIPATAEGSNP